MRRFFPLFLFVFTFGHLLSYPIAPQTLRKLIERSEYIVIATVENPDPPAEKVKHFDKQKNDTVIWIKVMYGGDGIADLNITEMLKGNPQDQQHMVVRYGVGVVCPAPAVYPDKKTVIAFLSKEEKSDTMFTEGLSYGSKIMNTEQELSLYKTRINEYLEILKIKEKQKKIAATVEWLTKCAENKYTRWDGAYDLSRGIFHSSHYDNSKAPNYSKELTENQLRRLDSAFFATEKVGYSELALSGFIDQNKYPQLKEHLLKSLAFSSYYLTIDILKRITEIYPNTELVSIYEEVENIEYNDKEKELKQKRLVKKFIQVATQ